jgi:predicted ATPase
MIIQYGISGFKCFSKTSFNLKEITILTGSNGTGKSTFIQGLLLARLGIEKNSLDPTNHDFVSPIWKGIPIPLNGRFALSLGTVYDIFNSSDSSEGVIAIKLGSEQFNITLPDSEENVTSANISHIGSISTEESVPFWRKREFYYLNTERLGPRHGLDFDHTDFIHCGYRGEYTAQVLLDYGFTYKITDQRSFTAIKSNNLQNQVDAWLNEICPGTLGVTVKPQGAMRGQIVLKASAAQTEVLAPNIGFGISYALPVIVDGLIAKKGSVYIVENPEAHLHPKGQSNIGYFLGKVASAGVKIIIETHSEHVVNGIRRASLDSENLTSSDVGIYFFNSLGSKREQILDLSINEKGELTKFPKDFFDQVNQDNSEIYRLKNLKKNG